MAKRFIGKNNNNYENHHEKQKFLHLSALIVAEACGNEKKRRYQRQRHQPPNASTAQTTTLSSATTKEILLKILNVSRIILVISMCLKIGKKNNVFQSTILFTRQIQYCDTTASIKIKLQSGETFGAELAVNRTYSNIKPQ